MPHLAEIFTSRSSLWVSLHCRDVEKTRLYIERSKSPPLKISLATFKYRSDALLLVAPHINRLSSLSVWGSADIVPNLIRNFSNPAPLLKRLEIGLSSDSTPAFLATLFNGDISSVHELLITGVTHLPWRNVSNLKVLELYHDPWIADAPFVTELLGFIENAPLLSDITLYSLPTSCNIPSRRVVHIPHLKKLILYSPEDGSTLLRHLSIPTGASLVIEFLRRGGNPSIPGCLPENFDNLNNLSDITSTSLFLGPETKHAQFDGPSGQLYLRGTGLDGVDSHTMQDLIFRCLQKFNPSRTQRLAVTEATSFPSPIIETLPSMNDLRTLTLIECKNGPFLYVLNPGLRAGAVACPNLEELILYTTWIDRPRTSELTGMASARAERCAKRLSLTIVSLGKTLPEEEELFTLREYFSRLDYKVVVKLPKWDALPGDGNGDRRDRLVERVL